MSGPQLRFLLTRLPLGPRPFSWSRQSLPRAVSDSAPGPQGRKWPAAVLAWNSAWSVSIERWLPAAVIAFWLYWLAVLSARLSVVVELASHFVWQAILGGGLVMLLCILKRRWALSLLAVVPWLYLVLLFQPWSLWLGKPNELSDGANRLKVMSWNVLCLNENLDELRTVIEDHPVDILVLVEVRPNLFEQVPRIAELYKHRLAYPSWGGNGIAILTDRDDIQLSRVDFDGRIMPSVVASVGDSIKVLGMHTWSPLPPSRAVPRDRQLSELTDWVKLQDGAVCVVGDLNITPWAPAFQKLLSTGLSDSRCNGFGNSASWPAWLGPLGIPIDHVLSRGSCSIVNRQLGPMVTGSDHRPVIFEVTY